MKTKRYLYWITVLTLIGFWGGIGLLVQSKADEPDSKPNTQVFLPFVTTGNGTSNAASITAQHIKIAQGAAGGGRIDAFTFFIPFATESAAAQFFAGAPATVAPNLPISTTISIAVNRDGSIVYYDQWEDTLEGDLTFPTQTTTLVWGDGDPTNNTTGLPPGVQLLGIPANDILTAGTIITLRNTVPSTPAARGTPPTIFFDGGDMLTSTGGALAVSTTFWTDIGPGILFTDAWELYPTNRWGTDYIVPIGQNVTRDGPGNRGEFEVVGLNIQAVENDTLIEIDSNADGVFDHGDDPGDLDLPDTTLDMGEQLSITSGILAGTRVRAVNGQPIQVHLFASDPDSTWEARGYTLVPVEQWTNDYLAPRASDGDFWLYNPSPTNPLTVTVQSITTTTSLNIPPNSTVRYPIDPTPPISNADMSGATGLHFTSNGPPFYGLAALDSEQNQDWGYSLLPTANLTSQTLVALGLGNRNSPGCPSNINNPSNNGRESRIYVTTLTTTTLFVDVNNDGITDTVDIDGDGVANPYPPGSGYLLLPLQEMSITDPSDCDMTGAKLFTLDGTPFASVWGQDQFASPALPSIDAGTTIVPLRSLAIQKTFTLLADLDCSGSISLGDGVRFQLETLNDSATILNSVIVSDTLPSALTYIPNTTIEDGQLVPDDSSGSAYPLDGSGLNTGLLDQFGASILTYDATVNNAGAIIINQANARTSSLPLQADAVTIFVPVGSPIPLLEITKTLIDPASGPVDPGQVVTFSLTITNTGGTTITTLPLEETYNPSHLTFLNSVPTPDVTATGVITWDDLTTISGPLLPNTSVSLTLSYMVNQIPAGTNNTALTATIRNAFRQNSPVPLTCSNEASLAFAAPPAPPPPPPPSSPPDSDDDDDDDKGPTPTPTPTPIPVAAIPAAPTAPAIPVAFLPETGLHGTGLEGWPIAGGLILLILGGFGLALRSRHKE